METEQNGREVLQPLFAQSDFEKLMLSEYHNKQLRRMCMHLRERLREVEGELDQAKEELESVEHRITGIKRSAQKLVDRAHVKCELFEFLHFPLKKAVKEYQSKSRTAEATLEIIVDILHKIVFKLKKR